MARANVETVQEVVLRLDQHEASVLRTVLSRVAGDPVTTPRGVTDRIKDVLAALVPPLSTDSYAFDATERSVRFIEPDSA